MAATKIEALDWRVIETAIRGGVCTPFLGAGVNASVDGGYEGLPLGAELAVGLLAKLMNRKGLTLKQLARGEADPELLKEFADLVGDLERVRAQDLARVALHIEVAGGKPMVLQYLGEMLPAEKREPSQLLRTLARLPFRLVVTTNYDRLLERASKLARQPEPVIVVQPSTGFRPARQRAIAKELAAALPADPAPRRSGEPLVIYMIHGALDDPAAQPIISEEDYIGFLDVVSRKPKAGVPPQIAASITKSSLLFLGYSLEDWDFRTLWKGLIEQLPREEKWRSFAIQKNPPPFWERFWASKGVTIYNLDLHEFAGELARRFRGR